MNYAPRRADEWGDQSVPRSVKKAETLVSSLGGFSDGGPQNIRSLHDLLQAIQPLHLELFQGTDLTEDGFLGEGASYRVKRCTARTSERAPGRIFAVKQVKLPVTSDREAFQSRVACVLKDIEVMSHPPLAQCDHILGLFGYGWRHHQGDIPFLVTEYAPRGTLRQFLIHNEELSGRNRFGFCRHVGSGLEWLHLSGVCHGDLKLENVLVTDGPPNEAGDATATATATATAKISDFGHSLLLSHADNIKPQRYLGTALYHPPEVSRERTDSQNTIDFQKCDIWAFGLLCWETMDGGNPYYENDRVFRLLWKTDNTRQAYSSRHATAEAVIQNLRTVQEEIPEISKLFAIGPLRNIVPSFTQRQIIQVLRSTLVLDPGQRIGDVTALPLAWRASVAIPAPAVQLADRSKKLSDWGFECFERWNSSMILWSVKEQMASDFHRSATTPGHSNSTARGAFQYALAHLFGFGVAEDPVSFNLWLQKSWSSGFQVSALVNRLLTTHKSVSVVTSDGTPDGHATYVEDQEEQVIEPESFTYTNTVGLARLWKSTKYYRDYSEFLRECFHYRDQSSSTKEHSKHDTLLNACKTGNLLDVCRLLAAGADPRVQDSDGCTTLHWLFMFPAAEVKDVAKLLYAKARILTIDEDKDTYMQRLAQWLNCICSKAVMGDPQLPFEVSGSPLTVGVASASIQMIESLLTLGADRMIGQASPTNRPSSPLLLSAYLHLPGILDILLNYKGRRLLHDQGQSAVHLLLEGLLRAICDCSYLERWLIHGRRVAESRLMTLQVIVWHLRDHWIEKRLNLLSLLKPYLERAVSYYDLDLVDALIRAFGSMPMSLQDANNESNEGPLLANPTITTAQILAAVDTACRSVYDKESSVALITRFASDKSLLNCTSAALGSLRPIDVVIKYRHEGLFDWLLDMGVHLNVQDDQGRAPLHHILGADNFGSERLERLLSLGAEPNVQDKEGITPLHLAVRKGACRELHSLLEYGADVKLQDQHGNCAVHFASESEDIEILAAIIAVTPSLHTLRMDGLCALSIACRRGQLECVRLLLDAGALPESGIRAAVESGRTDVVSLLINSSPKNTGVVDFLPYDNSSPSIPISVAAFRGDVEMVKLLIHEHANLSLRDRRGCTALHHVFIGERKDREVVMNDAQAWKSSILKYETTVKTLLSQPQAGQLRINTQDKDYGRTCLHYAAMCQPIRKGLQYNSIIGNMISFRYWDFSSLVLDLRRSGANPLIVDSQGRLSLHYAVMIRNLDVLYAVLTQILDGFYTILKDRDGLGVNVKDNDGNTPLNLAVLAYDESQDHQLMAIYMIFVLLAHNADAAIANNEGDNPYRSTLYKIRHSHHQQFVRARMILSMSTQTRPNIMLALEPILLTAVQIPVDEARGRSSLQLWAAQVTLWKGDWPRTDALITAFGNCLVHAGADLFGTLNEDGIVMHKPPLIEVLSESVGTTWATHRSLLALWLFKQHAKAIKQLERQLDPSNKLPSVIKPARIPDFIRQHVRIVRETLNFTLPPDVREMRDSVLNEAYVYLDSNVFSSSHGGGGEGRAADSQSVFSALFRRRR